MAQCCWSRSPGECCDGIWGHDEAGTWRWDAGRRHGFGVCLIQSFPLPVAVTSSKRLKLKRTFIGMWPQACLDPEAEKMSAGLSVSPSLHSVVLCAGLTPKQGLQAWWPRTPICVELGSPGFFLPTVTAKVLSQTLTGSSWVTCPFLNQLLWSKGMKSLIG